MTAFFRDLRYAARTLVRDPGYTATAVITLALGLGLTAAMFSVVDAVLFRPLPVEAPERLVRANTEFQGGGMLTGTTYPLFQEYRRRARTLAGVAAYSDVPRLDLEIGGERPERLRGMLVSGELFEVLGVTPPLGRGIEPADERPGSPPVAVLSDTLWRRRFGADPRAIGSVVHVGDQPVTVVGVAPAGFVGVDLQLQPDLWLPLPMIVVTSPDLAALQPLEGDVFSWLEIVGRLAPGASSAAVRAELSAIAAGATAADGSSGAPGEAARAVAVVPAVDAALGYGGAEQVTRLSWLLLGVVVLVLLVACADAATLILVRGERRRREIAVRLAIGGSRGRIVRQLLVESGLVAVLATAAGLLLAGWATDLLAAAAPERFPVPLGAASPLAGSRVIAFAAAAAALTVVLVGLGPALRTSRPELLPALKSELAGFTAGRRRLKLGDLLVVAQVALSTVLLAGAGLLLRTLWNASQVDLGFRAEGAAVATVELEGGHSADPARGAALYGRLLERVEAMPGVESAALVGSLPLTGSGMMLRSEVEGYRDPSGDAMTVLSFDPVTPGAFAALGIPLLAGRGFSAADGKGAPPVAIVNRAAAELYWPGQSPIGKHFGQDETAMEVVGVVGTTKVRSPREDPQPLVYVPLAQVHLPQVTLVARTAGDPRPLLPRLDAAVAELGPGLPPAGARTLRQELGGAVAQERLLAGLLGGFAMLALVLAAAGLYGVVSYSTEVRTRELGIRMSLGAERGDVLRLVLRQGAAIAAAGLGVGVAGALAAGRLLESLLFQVSPTDPATLAGAALVLALAVALAGLLPARRATRVDPAEALRAE